MGFERLWIRSASKTLRLDWQCSATPQKRYLRFKLHLTIHCITRKNPPMCNKSSSLAIRTLGEGTWLTGVQWTLPEQPGLYTMTRWLCGTCQSPANQFFFKCNETWDFHNLHFSCWFEHSLSIKGMERNGNLKTISTFAAEDFATSCNPTTYWLVWPRLTWQPTAALNSVYFFSWTKTPWCSRWRRLPPGHPTYILGEENARWRSKTANFPSLCGDNLPVMGWSNQSSGSF